MYLKAVIFQLILSLSLLCANLGLAEERIITYYPYPFLKKDIRVQLLGGGDTTDIYHLLDDPEKAIRLPIMYPRNKFSKRRFINYTLKGYQQLQRDGIPTVKIHGYAYYRYIIVDYIQGPTLRDFLINPGEWSLAERVNMLDALKIFAQKTAKYTYFGDFKTDSLMYDQKNKKWVLIDWTSNHKLYDGRNHTIFTYTEDPHYYLLTAEGKKWYDFVLETATRVILEERVKNPPPIEKQVAKKILYKCAALIGRLIIN